MPVDSTVDSTGYLYVYTPSRGDEVTIYLSGVSGVNGVETEGISSGDIYRMDGTRLSNDAALPAGI